MADNISVGASSFKVSVVTDLVDNTKELHSDHANSNEATNNDGL